VDDRLALRLVQPVEELLAGGATTPPRLGPLALGGGVGGGKTGKGELRTHVSPTLRAEGDSSWPGSALDDDASVVGQPPGETGAVQVLQQREYDASAGA
jgi:hypothetical protein